MQSKSETESGYSSLSFSKALLMYISLANLLDHCTQGGGTGSGSDRWGYNMVQIVEEDQHKAAFITNEGLFEPTVMSFRLTNSPATFQTMMDIIFREQIARGYLTVYMDNIVIHT